MSFISIDQKKRGEELARQAIITRDILLRIEDEINLYENICNEREPRARRPIQRKIKKFETKWNRFMRIMESVGDDLEAHSRLMGFEHKGNCLDCITRIQEAFEIVGGSCL